MSGGVSQPRNQLNPTVHIGSLDATTANASTSTRNAMDTPTVTMAQMNGTVPCQVPSPNHPQLNPTVHIGSSDVITANALESPGNVMELRTVVMDPMNRPAQFQVP